MAGDNGEVKITVVSPHRGDAAFSLALAIGSWIKAGHKVSVINCFSRSEEAPYSDAGSVHANDRMSFVTALRGREDEVWRRQYGSALSLVDLNMKDAPLRLHCKPEEVYGLTVNPNDKWLLKIEKVVEQRGGDAVVLPLGLGGHVDHLVARDGSLKLAGSEKACAFYEEQPVEGGVAEEFVRELERESRIDLKAGFVGAAVDVAAAVKRKRRAVFCYDSLIDDAMVEKIAGGCEAYGGRERLWGNAAWFGTDLSVGN